MADDPNKRGRPDSLTIALEQGHERRYWSKRLGVTEAQLEEAVKAVGRNAKAVEAHLGPTGQV